MVPYSKWMITLAFNWNPIGRTVRWKREVWVKGPIHTQILTQLEIHSPNSTVRAELVRRKSWVFRSNLWAELDVVWLDSLIFVVRIVLCAAFRTKLTRACFHFSVVLWWTLVSICIYFLGLKYWHIGRKSFLCSSVNYAGTLNELGGRNQKIAATDWRNITLTKCRSVSENNDQDASRDGGVI